MVFFVQYKPPTLILYGDAITCMLVCEPGYTVFTYRRSVCSDTYLYVNSGYVF